MNIFLLDWLASAREPLTTAQIWQELTAAGLRQPPPGLPQKLSELSQAMLALHIGGKIEALPGDRWQPVRKVVKAERSLFQ